MLRTIKLPPELKVHQKRLEKTVLNHVMKQLDDEIKIIREYKTKYSQMEEIIYWTTMEEAFLHQKKNIKHLKKNL